MKKLVSYCWILLVLCCCEYQLYAQRQNIWVWGSNAGINFNSSSPAAVSYNNIIPGIGSAFESAASICDNFGQLLFYTEGSYVFNRQQNMMPNGQMLTGIPNVSTGGGLTATGSSSQGSIILPKPGSSNQYYIFSMTAFETGQMGRLYYSVVDMNLNSGMGDIVVGQKGILIDTDHSEQMAAVAHCGDYWLITISRVSSEFRAYKITSSGISAPINSPIINTTYNNSGVAGNISVASNGKKIAVLSGFINGLSMFDFDATTGILSNQAVIDATFTHMGRGLCFSPDNSKLYINYSTAHIYQYDLSAGNTAAIFASKTAVVTASNQFTTHLKLASNGKIYFTGGLPSGWSFNTSSLSSINNPNAAGLACQPQLNSINLVSGTSHHVGLPTDIPVYQIDTQYSVQQKNSCNQSIEVVATDTTGSGYVWNDGFASKKRSISVSGTYWARYQTPCGLRVDTFHITVIPPIQQRMSKIICGNDSIIFGGKFLKTTGIYRDTIKTSQGCDSILILDLIVVPPQSLQINFENKEALCLEDSLSFMGSGAQLYQWLVNGEHRSFRNPTYLNLSEPINEVMLIGSSVIGGSDASCIDTAYVSVNAISCCELFVPNAFSPNSDGVNDLFAVKTNHWFRGFMFEIYNRWGSLVFSTNQPSEGWDGTYLQHPADIGVYHYYIRYTCDDGKNRFIKGDITLLR